MTLVVARQVNGEVYIVGDTKFTEASDSVIPESRKYIGGLKVVLLGPGLCVGFSGNVEIARNAIQGIYDKEVNLFEKNHAIEYFLEHHRYSIINDPANTTDFIVVSIVENNENPGTFLKEIFRIADSKVYWENETTHIGSKVGFNCFQKSFHNGRQKPNLPTFQIAKLGATERPGFDPSLSAAMSAMQGVIDNPNVLDVGGYCTVVVSEENQFKYVAYLQLSGTPIPVRNEQGAPVSFGDAAEGSDHKYVGFLTGIGHGVFPVYSITGRFGLIYHPEGCFEPTIIRNCSEEEFRAKVEERIDVAHQRALMYQARFYMA